MPSPWQKATSRRVNSKHTPLCVGWCILEINIQSILVCLSPVPRLRESLTTRCNCLLVHQVSTFSHLYDGFVTWIFEELFLGVYWVWFQAQPHWFRKEKKEQCAAQLLRVRQNSAASHEDCGHLPPLMGIQICHLARDVVTVSRYLLYSCCVLHSVLVLPVVSYLVVSQVRINTGPRFGCSFLTPLGVT